MMVSLTILEGFNEPLAFFKMNVRQKFIDRARCRFIFMSQDNNIKKLSHVENNACLNCTILFLKQILI